MSRRTSTAFLALLALAGCQRDAQKPQPGASDAAAVPAATATPPLVEPSIPPEPAALPGAVASEPAPSTGLDTAALGDRKNPDRLLRYYAAALHARDWPAAARAWGKGSGVTAKTLRQSYDRAEPPVLELGKGVQDAGAGSLYYEAPVTLRFGGARPERGSLVLRRVNDVDGASADQLRWHIERSTIGQGQ